MKRAHLLRVFNCFFLCLSMFNCLYIYGVRVHTLVLLFVYLSVDLLVHSLVLAEDRRNLKDVSVPLAVML